MRSFFLCGWVFFSALCVFGQEPDTTESLFFRNECALQPQPEVIRKLPAFRIGAYAGYVSAFAKATEKGSGSIVPLPGIEAAFVYERFLKQYFRVQSGIGYTSRNFRVESGGAAFDQRNDRLFIPLIVSRPVWVRGPEWLVRTTVHIGTQVDVYRISSPISRFDEAAGVQHTVTTNKKPEVLLVGGLSYMLKRLPVRGIHTFSVMYAYGLSQTAHGELVAAAQTAFRYSTAGSNLSVRYTYWLVKNYKKK
jgi:hypothetical protein